MRNDWILDVLADLQTFARTNKLTALAEQLGDTKLIAAAELLSVKQKVREHCDEGDFAVRENTGSVGTSRRA
jgi:hypothetical protein